MKKLTTARFMMLIGIAALGIFFIAFGLTVIGTINEVETDEEGFFQEIKNFGNQVGTFFGWGLLYFGIVLICGAAGYGIIASIWKKN